MPFVWLVRYLFDNCSIGSNGSFGSYGSFGSFGSFGSRLQTRSSHSSLVHITEQGDLRTFPRLPPRLSSKPDYGDQDMVREVTPKHAPHSITINHF